MTIRLDCRLLATTAPVFPGIGVFRLLGDLGIDEDALATIWAVLGRPGFECCEGDVLRNASFLEMHRKAEASDPLILGHALG